MTNELAIAPSQPRIVATQATAIEQSRAIAEVQAAVVVAQQCPRDMGRAEGEMRDACGRLAVAQRAFYRVPNRGEGPSVHLARELARIWGNVQYGVHELRRDDEAGMSEVQAFAWDVQTNTRSTRTFQVPHQRMKKVNGRQTREALVDLNDVYLNNQNVGARAVRECVFTVLPTWFVEAAEQLARETLRNGEGVPLPQRIESMVSAFATEFGIKAAQIESKLSRKRGQWDAGDVASMIVLYNSIKRGEVTVAEEFPGESVSAEQFMQPPATAAEQAPAEPEAPPAETPAPAARQGVRPGGIDGSDRISTRTRGRLFALMSELGVDDEDEQRAGMSRILGREVESRKTLTEDEGKTLITHLEGVKAERAEQAGSPS